MFCCKVCKLPLDHISKVHTLIKKKNKNSRLSVVDRMILGRNTMSVTVIAKSLSLHGTVVTIWTRIER